MKIESNYPHYIKNSNRVTGTSNMPFEEYLIKKNNFKADPNKDQFIKTEGMKYNNIGIYSKTDNNISESDLEFPIETERYTIELANELEGVQAYLIEDKEFGYNLYIREDELIISQDAETGKEFIFNMDDPLCTHLLVTNELKSVLNNLAQKRGFELKTGPMQGGLAIYRDTKTGLSYMAIKGNEGKGMAVIVSSQKDLEIIENLKNEFMKYPVVTGEATAYLYALLEISGNLRRGEDGLTYLTPNGVTYIPYDGDIKKAWEIEMSSEYYAIARKNLNGNIDFENADAWKKILNGANITNGFIDIFTYYNVDSTKYNFQYK